MVEFIWEPILVAAAILLCSTVGYGLLLAGRRTTGQKPTKEKMKTYACGESLRPEEMHADSEQFFSPVRRVLRPFYQHIQSAHTGKLNTYLLWTVVGFVIILAVLLLTLR